MLNDILAAAFVECPLANNTVALEFRLGGSTDAEVFPVWSFDNTSGEQLDFFGRMSPRYTGAAFKLRFGWLVAGTATTGAVRWAAAFRRLDTAEDIDVAHTYVEQATTTTAPGTAGRTAYTEIAFTQAQADSIAAGELFVLRLRRDGANAADTMAEFAHVYAGGMQVIET